MRLTKAQFETLAFIAQVTTSQKRVVWDGEFVSLKAVRALAAQGLVSLNEGHHYGSRGGRGRSWWNAKATTLGLKTLETARCER